MNVHTRASLARRTLFAVSALAAVVALSGCMMDPPGPSPIYSRLPADQSGVPTGAQALTPEERQRYDAIDKQVLADQNRAIAAEQAAETWSRYYSAPAPMTVYGSYYSGGWGHGWGTGIGYGYPGWGWGW
ncbi:hypothetical protein [Paraburkholderia kururiensis]|uniref:Lipoprotein n=1 Tax=Paraburkholderia kururiensis TaxID=984307 RepID=A0ABZ0WJK3_9BURK|nr:hypothetical protein [Paraburkholderia kururiensis]WQD77509.1 hypothetical protein U0042_26245 [Paraburkholderia kururiensis]